MPVTTRKFPLASDRAVATISSEIFLIVMLLLAGACPMMVGALPTVRTSAGAVIARLEKIQLALLLPASVQLKHVTVLVRASESLTFKTWTVWAPLGKVIFHLLPADVERKMMALARVPSRDRVLLTVWLLLAVKLIVLPAAVDVKL